MYDAWCEVVVMCKETVKETKSTYDAVKKESDGKLHEQRLAVSGIAGRSHRSKTQHKTRPFTWAQNSDQITTGTDLLPGEV